MIGWILGGIASFLLIVLIAMTVYSYFVAFYHSPKKKNEPYVMPASEQYDPVEKRMRELIEELELIPYERVQIRSHDGLTLSARYYHFKDGAPVQIQCHGYKGVPVRDFCGGHKLAREKGHNVLLIDQRAHGDSEGNTITFGILERKDVLSWIEYVNGRVGKNVPVILTGISMGAATVLMAASLPLPENVVGIVADCPYSSPSAILKKVSSDMKLPPALTYPFLQLGARLFGGFHLEETSAVEGAKNSKVPILLIHGEDDRFVPCDMSREIAAASKHCRLQTFEGAGHGISFMIDEARYAQLTSQFIDEQLTRFYQREGNNT